ncbi:hypothetical protein VCHA42P256_90167 [Vibrio chagasii]|nr:hypothetical protein VCHA42P256_90167 [Vibrio chagasii]
MKQLGMQRIHYQGTMYVKVAATKSFGQNIQYCTRNKMGLRKISYIIRTHSDYNIHQAYL